MSQTLREASFPIKSDGPRSVVQAFSENENVNNNCFVSYLLVTLTSCESSNVRRKRVIKVISEDFERTFLVGKTLLIIFLHFI